MWLPTGGKVVAKIRVERIESIGINDTITTQASAALFIPDDKNVVQLYDLELEKFTLMQMS